MPRKILPLAVLGLILAACGTIATPVFEEELQETRIAEAATSAAETAAAPTLPPTMTPSETPTEPPTATPTETLVPPTETPEPTEEPATETPVATEAEATDEAATTEEAGGTTGGNEVTGDPANGQTLFTTFYAQANFACNTCHLVDSESQLIGPGLLNVATRAETRVEGQTAAEYIHNSIVHPSDYVVEGYPDMLMPQVYGDIFTEEEINDLVAYLFTLHD